MKEFSTFADGPDCPDCASLEKKYNDALKKIERTQKTLEFYATHSSWDNDQRFSETAIIKSDMSLVFFYEEEHYCGGRMARETLRDLKLGSWGRSTTTTRKVWGQLERENTVIEQNRAAQELLVKIYGPRFCEKCEAVQKTIVYEKAGTQKTEMEGMVMNYKFMGSIICSVCGSDLSQSSLKNDLER